jgi:hypothetical protein
MCLKIQDIPYATVPPKETVVVYKWYLCRCGSESYKFESPYLSSLYDSDSLGPGRTIVSNRPGRPLTEKEKECSEVYHGLHAFESLEGVLKDANSYRGCVFEMEGAPVDFVARGRFGKNPSVVFTALKVKRAWELCFRSDGARVLGKELWPEISKAPRPDCAQEPAGASQIM